MPNTVLDLSMAFAPHVGSVLVQAGSPSVLIYSDGQAVDWNVIRIPAPGFYQHRVSMRIWAKAQPGANSLLYLAHIGGIDLGFVDLEHGVAHRREAMSLDIEKRDDGWEIQAVFVLADDAVIIGSASHDMRPQYAGSGKPQFAISEIQLEIAYEAAGSRPRLTLVDVGAAGGLQPKWEVHARNLDVVLVEPDPVAAERLSKAENQFHSQLILQVGLAERDGPRTLYLTQFPECSSLLKPDAKILDPFSVRKFFKVVGEETVVCNRYDTLHGRGESPVADFIKIDVQGAQLAVLEGFGKLLSNCLGIEVEAHFYPIYEGEGSIDDLVRLLDKHGLCLRRLEECRTFDDELVEVNAFFTRRPNLQFSPKDHEKLKFIEEVNNLKHYALGRQLAGTP